MKQKYNPEFDCNKKDCAECNNGYCKAEKITCVGYYLKTEPKRFEY